MFLTILKITLIGTNWSLFQNALILELEFFIKRSFIFIIFRSLNPSQYSFHFSSIDILTFECITLTLFFSLTMECVFMKTSIIGKLWILIMSILILGFVINKISFIKRSVRKDENWRSLWFSLFKVSNN